MAEQLLPALEGVDLTGPHRVAAQIFLHQSHDLLYIPRLIVANRYAEHPASAPLRPVNHK